MANNIDGIVKALYDMGFRGTMKLEPTRAITVEMTTESRGLVDLCLINGDTASIQIDVGDKWTADADTPFVKEMVK